MTTVIVIQARMGSTRCPGKMMKPLIQNRGALEVLLERLSITFEEKDIIVATTSHKQDDCLEEIAKKFNMSCYRGSEDDVLDRYYQAVNNHSKDIETIVRITGDCPLHDPIIIKELMTYFSSNNFDYVSNALEPTYPDGLDVEVFSYNALSKAWNNAKLLSEREHVTPYIIKNKAQFSQKNIAYTEDLSHHRWTLDEESDYQFIKSIYEGLYPSNKYFRMRDV